MKKIISSLIILVYFISPDVYSRENSNSKSQNKPVAVAAGCSPSTSHADLDIGNVRAPIWINGDMWWDLSGSALYEIPKNSGKHSLFSGAIWIGGKDGSGNLKIAAQTYRQSGSDFWPGPIDTANVSVNAARCLHYDRMWKITRQEVYDFVNGAPPSQVIQDWPGNGDPAYSESSFLAPFYDNNGDGIYSVADGDYPKYYFGTQPPGTDNRLLGDQTIWWVFNDVGNVHSETNSVFPIGLEIRAQAYAFCSDDSDLSNTTFYTYQFINRSSSILYETAVGQFTDVDLGYYQDDYVGCDVGRDLGYGYNGDDLDEGANGYGTLIPAVGIDILQGPLADAGDQVDNDHDSIIDEPGEEILMSGFMYYNNDASVTGNPVSALDHYYYMTNTWKDQSHVLYGGSGWGIPGAPACNYMYPGNSDPSHYGTQGVDPGFEWSEKNPCIGCGPINPSDRRFIMSSGKFTMIPGQVSYLTKAAVWARVPGGADSSLHALLRVDDKIQDFFDNNFSSISTCALTIGIDELEQINFSVFPSVTTDKFTIQLKDKYKSISLKVFSSDGKLVYDADEKKSQQFVVDASGWESGIYYFQLHDETKKYGKGKIVVIND